MTNAVRWTKSTKCAAATCVEVAQVGDEFLIRDSKNPDAESLRFTKAEWDAFVAGVKNGEFRF